MSNEKFSRHGTRMDGKCVFIRGPVDIEIDRDDCDSAFVDDLVPAIIEALNGEAMQGAITRAYEAQAKRWASEEST